MNAFKRFDQGLTAWSGQLGRGHNPAMNPAMKNRLQAIGEIRTQVSRVPPVGEFGADIALLLQAVRKCQDEFEPMFDTDYGSGRDVHNTMIGLLWHFQKSRRPGLVLAPHCQDKSWPTDDPTSMIKML